MLRIRPAQFQDPAVDERPGRFRFRVRPDIVESIGCDVEVHFPVDSCLVGPRDLVEPTVSTGGGEEVVARLQPAISEPLVANV